MEVYSMLTDFLLSERHPGAVSGVAPI